MNLARELDRLEHGHEESLRFLGGTSLDTLAPSVSSWSVAQHLQHIALVNLAALELIRRIHADDERALARKGRMNMAGIVFLGTGRIPRGKGRAPENVRPPEELQPETVRDSLLKSRDAARELSPLLAELPLRKGRFPHPAFGLLDGSQWLRFARVHVEHHLAIVRDILHAS